MTTILYFASLKSRLGSAREIADVPQHIATIADLVEWLRGLSPQHAEAFADLKTLRVALNQEHVGFDSAFKAGDEIAFFPPVTGG